MWTQKGTSRACKLHAEAMMAQHGLDHCSARQSAANLSQRHQLQVHLTLLSICVQGKALHSHLKRHLVQLEYADTDPFIPSLCGTKVHPIPVVPPLPITGATSSVTDSDLHDSEMDVDMQAAMLADVAAMAGVVNGVAHL